jgi:predicted lipoprotein with Yx(FWY)xxD motif
MALGALALVGLMFGGCGGGTSTNTTASDDEVANGREADDTVAAEPAALASGVSAPAVVRVASTPDGPVIVDSQGRTLYDSHGDDSMLYQFNRPPTPSCYEACAEVWIPLLTDGSPKAIGAAEESLMGTIRREDGSRQVTYDGRPLYRFVEDTRPGETNGNYAVSFREEWHALEPDGEELRISSGG